MHKMLMAMVRFIRFAFGALVLLKTFGAEPELDLSTLVRVPPTAPENALSTFSLKEGFRLELVAAEPLVTDPIALCFDENSRLFVVEMRDYSERRQEQLGRIRLLEDTDGDGRMDKATVFAEDLPWPTALFWANGGLFVGATPDILFFKDTDNDGKADLKEVVFSGFGADVPRLNVQALMNCFHWGLDNRIHGASGGTPGKIKGKGNSETELRNADFSWDPHERDFRLESGGGQYGLTFDNFGRKFVCSNSSHTRQVVYERHYLTEQIQHALPAPSLDIAVEGPAAEVFRISPEEPWRIIRTRWRVAGLVPGPIEGGGRASGYFTSATGLVVYRGTALGEECLGDIFVADVGSNLIHRKKVRPNGAIFQAERPADELTREFLASKDNWFRPVQMINGPDGGLYIADMYREVVEHPWSIPPNLKRHIDLNSGNDRGRVYRVIDEKFQRASWPKLGPLKTAELVSYLEHPNGWHRDTAARLIFERQEKSVGDLLRKMTRESGSPFGRVHALAALSGLGLLGSDELMAALKSDSEDVREFALSLVGEVEMSQALLNRVQQLAEDPSPRVRAQLGWQLSRLEIPRKAEMLGILLARAQSEWEQHPALAAASVQPVGVLERMPAQARSGLRTLASLAGRHPNRDERVRAAEKIKELAPEARLAASAGYLQSIAKSYRNELEKAAKLLGKAQHDAEVELRKDDSEQFQDAVTVLAAGALEKLEALLEKTFSLNTTGQRQQEFLQAASPFLDRENAARILRSWGSLTPAARQSILQEFLARSSLVVALLDAVQENGIPVKELPRAVVQQLRAHSDRQIRAVALKVFPTEPTVSRAAVYERYKSALEVKGNAEAGKAIYSERCSSCHRLYGVGTAVGPDLESVRSAGKHLLLQNIIDPNREVPPRYATVQIETTDGEESTGILTGETPAGFSLKQATGQDLFVPRSSVKGFRSTGSSLMPEGLEEGLTPGQMADLLAYILSE